MSNVKGLLIHVLPTNINIFRQKLHDLDDDVKVPLTIFNPKFSILSSILSSPGYKSSKIMGQNFSVKTIITAANLNPDNELYSHIVV